MNLPALLVEWVVPTLFTFATPFWMREPTEDGRLARFVWRWRWPLLLATRFAWPALLFAGLGYETVTDLGNRAARSALFLDGAVPGVDFADHHAPLTPYLEGVGRWLTPGRHATGTMLFYALGDIAAVLFGARLAERYGGSRGTWAGAWLVLTPLLWHQLGIRAQDESLFAGALAVALWLANARRDVAVGAVLAVGLCATKPTFAPYAATLLLALGLRRWRATAAFALVTAAVYGGQALIGVPLIAEGGVSYHAVNFGSGFSIPDAIARFFPGLSPRAAVASYVLITGTVMVSVPLLHRAAPVEERSLRSLAAVHAASMLTMPFCVSPYFAQGIVPLLLLALAAPPRTARVLLGALPVLAWLCVMHWTKSRVFSIPMKPTMIAFHAFVLVVAARPGAGWRPTPREGDDPDAVSPAPGVGNP